MEGCNHRVVQATTPLQLNEVEHSTHEHAEEVRTARQTIEPEVSLVERGELGVVRQMLTVAGPACELRLNKLAEVHPVANLQQTLLKEFLSEEPTPVAVDDSIAFTIVVASHVVPVHLVLGMVGRV